MEYFVQDIEFRTESGYDISGTYTRPEQDTDMAVIISHGYASHKNRGYFMLLEQELTSMGIAVFRFDYPGHGDSSGTMGKPLVSEFSSVLDEAVAKVKGKGHSKIGLYGRSMGGAVTIWNTSNQNDADFLILHSPVSDLSWVVSLRKRPVRNLNDTLHGHIYPLVFSAFTWVRKLSEEVRQEAVNTDLYEMARNIKIPTFIVHGSKDALVPFSQSDELVKHLNDANLLELPNTDHGYANKYELAMAHRKGLDFIRKVWNIEL